MNKWIWKSALAAGMVCGGLMLAQVAHSGSKAKTPDEQTIVIKEPGKPERRGVIEKSTPQPDGTTKHRVRLLDTNETIEIVDARKKEKSVPAPLPNPTPAPAKVVKTPYQAIPVSKSNTATPFAKERKQDPLFPPGYAVKEHKYLSPAAEASKGKAPIAKVGLPQPITPSADDTLSRFDQLMGKSQPATPMVVTKVEPMTPPMPMMRSAELPKQQPVLVRSRTPEQPVQQPVVKLPTVSVERTPMPTPRPIQTPVIIKRPSTPEAVNGALPLPEPKVVQQPLPGTIPMLPAPMSIAQEPMPTPQVVQQPTPKQPIFQPIGTAVRPTIEATPAVRSTPVPVQLVMTPAPIPQPTALTFEERLMVQLVEALRPSEREAAAVALVQGRTALSLEVTAALVRAAQADPATTVRACCIHCLAGVRCTDPSFIASLDIAFKDPDALIRSEATAAKKRLGLK